MKSAALKERQAPLAELRKVMQAREGKKLKAKEN